MFDALKKKISEAQNQVASLSADVMQHIKVSEEDRMARLEICKSCDQFHKTEFCKVCSCYMPAKTWLPYSKCPMSKWGVIVIKKE